VGIKDGFETIQVEMKAKDGEKDAKDGNEYQIGEEEIRNHDVKGGEKYLIGDPKVWREDEPMKEDLEKKMAMTTWKGSVCSVG